MKKIFFVALGATLLAASCQKTEVINPVGGPVMSFTTGMGKITKSVGAADAEAAGIRNLEAQDFSVWAYADPESDFESSTVVDATTNIYDGIANLLVECTAASQNAVVDDPTTENVDETTAAVAGTWGTAQEYFWPGENKNLLFFAVSADGDWLRPAAPATCPVTIDYTVPSITVNDFTVRAVKSSDGTKTAANEDLMVADFVKQNQSDKVVDLKFRHTLSKVEFVFKTLPAATGETAPTVYVQSLKVADLQNKGDLSVTAVDPDATPIVWKYEWTNDTTSDADFTDDYETVVTYAETVEAAAKADNTAMLLTTTPETFATWLMLPQIIKGKKVEITYIINNRQFTSVFPIDNEDTKLTEWAYNQHIKYTITLAPNVISFNPSVEEWTTPATNVEYQN